MYIHQIIMNAVIESPFSIAPYQNRYRQGECRDRIFFDLIATDLDRLPPPLTILDIGCGRGFDGDLPLQQKLAERADRFLGVEPDRNIKPGDYFQQVFPCILEEADIPSGSVDLAYAVMVLEHLGDPQPFWDKVYQILRPGGVFWGLTVDRRHWFTSASHWLERLRIKEWYLNWVLGRRGQERYENYPTYYRSNQPRDIEQLARRFSQKSYYNFYRPGQLADYLPWVLRPILHGWDRTVHGEDSLGTLLAVRVQK